MLQSLSVSNVALIEKQGITFYDGFSVLTGETGAGKSIIVESLSFVLGERANRDLIKSGAQKASVEAVFSLRSGEPVCTVLKDNELLPDDGTLVLYREFSETGKSVCRVNGTLIPASMLKLIGDALVDIHGQHEHQALLNPKLHLRMLDSLGGDELARLRSELSADYAVAYEAGKKLRSAEIDEHERERRCDLISYQLAEIDKAGLSEEEEAALLERRGVLQNAQAIMESLVESSEIISGETGVLPLLSQALRSLEGIAGFHGDYAALHDALQEAYYAIEEASYGLRDQKDSFSFEPDALNQLEWRLETISSMKRKYGDSVSDILRYRDKISEEYELLSTSEERRDALKRSYSAAQHSYMEKAERLSTLRKSTAEALRSRLLPELSDLGMPHAEFEVRFERLAGELPSSEGLDDIEFMLSTNKGEPVKPLAKVASGGEISRIMLAFKSVLADLDGIPTMVFDEIDSGISGKIGTSVAEKMRQLASSHQILCITHLPQIAAHAQRQYLVYKETTESGTRSAAKLLSDDERAKEIARIMGAGSDDSLALAHAQSLLQSASGFDAKHRE